jgi:Spy/CpxP family protein refolding chaperone
MQAMKRSVILAVGAFAALSFAPLHAADPATPPQPPAEKSDTHKPMHPGKMGRQHEGPGGWGMHRGMDRGPRGFRDKKGAGWGGPGGAACEQGGACPVVGMLQLTDDQKQKLKDAMKTAEPKIAAIRAEEQAKIAEVIAQTVRPFLDEKQQAVFDDLQKLRQDKLQLKAAAPADTKTSE